MDGSKFRYIYATIMGDVYNLLFTLLLIVNGYHLVAGINLFLGVIAFSYYFISKKDLNNE